MGPLHFLKASSVYTSDEDTMAEAFWTLCSCLRSTMEAEKGVPGRRTDISKALTNVLRHSAGKLGLDIGSDGYVPVCQIRATRRFQSQGVTIQELVYTVTENDKQRFQLQWGETSRNFCQEGPQGLWLLGRAVQGPSMAQVDTDQLEPPSMPQVAVHGKVHLQGGLVGWWS